MRHSVRVASGDNADTPTGETLPFLKQALLHWYGLHVRPLPWRLSPADPYKIWVSEIMLQQTTVATVKERYARFLSRWPTLASLAAAPLDDVLHEWQGLGYYARARNLHRCATVIMDTHGGMFPHTEAVLRTLPGIGDYTAAAIAALAFDSLVCPIDTNGWRVMARLLGLNHTAPKGHKIAKAHAEKLLKSTDAPWNAGRFAQGIMELGALVCTPRAPRCTACPWAKGCHAHQTGTPEHWPKTPTKKAKPVRHGVIFWLTNPRGAVLMRRRMASGLLGGMAEFPSTTWTETAVTQEDVRRTLWALGEWQGGAWQGGAWQDSACPLTPLPERVRHVFTHFVLELEIRTGVWPVDGMPAEGSYWCHGNDLPNEPLPTLMKKVARIARDAPVPSVENC